MSSSKWTFNFSRAVFLVLLTNTIHDVTAADKKTEIDIIKIHEKQEISTSKSVHFATSGSGQEKVRNKTKELRSFNAKAQVLTVIIDSSRTGAKIIADVINYENNAAAYTVHLTDCSENVPVERFELAPAVDRRLPHISNYTVEKSHVYLIPPRRSRPFIIDLDYRNSSKKLRGEATCILNVLNRFNTKLHTKLIKFSPDDSCVCSTNCECSCFREDALLECKPISDSREVLDWKRKNEKELSVGGRSEALQSASNSSEKQIDEKFLGKRTKWWNSYLDDDKHIVYLSLLLAILISLLLLLLGALKGLLGCCCFPIGRLGLKHFYDKPRLLDHYYEDNYEKYQVIHDSEGYPVDPFTRARSVKRLNPKVAFLLNMTFFLCCPIFCLYWIKDCCFKDAEYAGFDDDGEISHSPNPNSGRMSRSACGPTDLNSSRVRTMRTSRQSSGRMSSANTTPIMQKSLAESRVSQSTTNEQNIRLAVEGSQLAKSILASADESEYELTPVTSKDLLYPDESEDDGVEGGEEISKGNSNTSQRTFIAGHACVYPEDHTPMSLTPLQNSSAILNMLAREPQEPDRPSRKRAQEENHLCCGSNQYGSWHRSPAIFGDDYDGESRFDLVKTTEMSRRRSVGPGGSSEASKAASILSSDDDEDEFQDFWAASLPQYHRESREMDLKKENSLRRNENQDPTNTYYLKE
ncbi:unnamed protein product [Allacma fusca]|uniref:Generative cell specific-1/HAP2 domain-containing protein n=1 Tax=Allacma fusca TaxID=39272 RepID=A0A8J2JPC0_9HEXA|nr:unnamed protein product [Allacma fusca]